MVRSYITFAIKRFLAHALLTANRFAYSPKILIPNISLATPKGKAFLQCDFIFVYTQLNRSTVCAGADGRPRSDALLLTRQSLYQLSYTSIEAVLTSQRLPTLSPITFILLKELGACISLDVYTSYNHFRIPQARRSLQYAEMMWKRVPESN